MIGWLLGLFPIESKFAQSLCWRRLGLSYFLPFASRFEVLFYLDYALPSIFTVIRVHIQFKLKRSHGDHWELPEISSERKEWRGVVYHNSLLWHTCSVWVGVPCLRWRMPSYSSYTMWKHASAIGTFCLKKCKDSLHKNRRMWILAPFWRKMLENYSVLCKEPLQ